MTEDSNLPVTTYTSAAFAGLVDAVNRDAIVGRGGYYSSNEEGVEESAVKHDGDLGAVAPVPSDPICRVGL